MEPTMTVRTDAADEPALNVSYELYILTLTILSVVVAVLAYLYIPKR